MENTKISNLEIQISSNSSSASKSLDELTASLNSLKTVLKGNVVGNNLKKISEGLAGVNANASGMKNLNKALKGTNGTLTTYTKSVSNATKSTNQFGNIFSSLKVKIGIVSLALHGVTNAISNHVKNSNDYVENMEIFSVAMGKMYDEAYAYAELVNDKLKIDISEWTRNQAIFASMANGFGLAEEQAYKLSKGLTEVAYDLASLYNMETEEAFNKVRSGLAGELEPLRGLGFALDQATLQQVAYAHGVDLAYSKMTQSQKAMLRYTAIVEQAGKDGIGAIGNMAKTLESPANSIRILKQQFKQLSRQIGNVFIPILVQVIPYVQAFTKILTDMISKLAILVGFEMPKYGDEGKSFESTSSAIDEATESAKELKNATMGFDELNVISPNTSSASTDNGYAEDLGLDIAEVWDNAMLEEINHKMDEIIKKFHELFNELGKNIKNITKIDGEFSGLGVTLGLLAGVGILGLLLSLPKLFAYLGSFGSLLLSCKSLGDVGMLLGMLWTDAMVAIGGALSAIFSPVGALVAVVAILIGVGVQLYNTSEQFRNKVNELVTLIGTTFNTVLTNLLAIIGSVKAVFEGFWKDVIVPLWNFLVTFLEPAFLILTDILTMLWKYVIDPLAVTISGVFREAFESVSNLLTEKVFPAFRLIIEVITDLWQNYVNPFVMWLWEIFKPMFETVFNAVKVVIETFGKAVSQIIDGACKVIGGLIDFLVGVFTGDWDKAWNGVKDIFDGIWDMITGAFDGIVSNFFNFGKNIIQGIIDGIQSMVGALMNTVSGIVDKIKSAFSSIGEGISNAVSSVGSALGFGSSSGGEGQPLSNTDLVALQNIGTPVTVDQGWGYKHSVVWVIEEDDKFADGGAVGRGQMFIARENGAELVGNIGNTTAVMNNEQIVQAVAQGVASAVASVMGGSNSQNITVNLDGEVVYRNQQKVSKRLGYNLGI